MAKNLVLAFFLSCGGVLPIGAERAAFAQPAAQPKPAGRQFDLTQTGEQTIVLEKFPYPAQKAGRVACRLSLKQGELTNAALVIRMFSSDGADVSGRVRLLGGYDQTLVVPIEGLKPGSPVQIVKDIVTASFTSSVRVELKANVKNAPVAVLVEELTLEERRGEPIESNDIGPLVAAPEKGFAYSRNLLPAMDSAEWNANGPAARRGKGPGNQPVLALDEYGEGKWESPIIPLEDGVKELSLQTFVKFDAMATPYEHPFQVVFRDRGGKTIKLPAVKRGWPLWEWNMNDGQWIPLSLRFAVPDQAASAQLVMELGKGFSAPWQNKGEVTKNNFVTFQTIGLRLWASNMPSAAGISPYNFTDFAGGVANAGPFVPCKAQQENSIALWTHINDLSNLYFSKEGKWPAPRARVENFLPIRRTLELTGKIFDWAGNPVGEVSRTVKLDPYQVTNVELPIENLKRTGCYSLNLDAMQDGVLVGQGVVRWGYFREPNDRADRRDLRYPFCFHPGVSAQGGFAGKYVDLELRTLRAMGVRGFRLQCRLWGLNGTDAEKAIDSVREYSDNFHKQVWPYMQKYGFDGYITFFPKPRSPIPAAGSPEMEAWKKYVAAAVKLYPEISTFAFGNEEIGHSNKTVDDKPEVWGYSGSMRDYTREFKAAREAALEARPDITFIVGQASDPDANVAKLFFEAGGTAEDVQGWAINSYNSSAATWKNAGDVLRKNGVDMSKAIGLIPEIGYGVPRRGPRRIREEQGEAIKMVKTQVEILAAAPWVRDINWFTTVSRGSVVHNFVFDTDWSPKPMVGAYLTLTSTLGAGRPVSVDNKSDAKIYLWQRIDGSKAGVVWASKKQELRLRVGKTNGPVIVRDIMGNDTPAPIKEGVITVGVSDQPVYLLNIQTLTEEEN